MSAILVTNREDRKKKSSELVHLQDQTTSCHNSNELHSSSHHAASSEFPKRGSTVTGTSYSVSMTWVIKPAASSNSHAQPEEGDITSQSPKLP